MTRAKPGERVGALMSAKDGVVYLFGYGVYVGDEVPSLEAGGFGEMVRAAGAKNPKIVLDSGKVVWGCECWWGPEKAVREKLKQYDRIVEVDIDQERAKEAREPCSSAN